MNTPRTDAVLNGEKDITWHDHASQLERELSAEQEKVRELREALYDVYYQSIGQLDKKTCGHPFYCVCLDKKTKAALEATK